MTSRLGTRKSLTLFNSVFSVRGPGDKNRTWDLPCGRQACYQLCSQSVKEKKLRGMVEETSKVKELYPYYLCNIGLKDALVTCVQDGH